MSDGNTFRVGMHTYKPVVYREGDKWVGLETELWEKIAERLQWDFEYFENTNFSDLLDKTSAGEYDVAMAGISRTVEREQRLHMSYFTLDTGLGIATMPAHSFSIKDLFRGVFSKQTTVLLGILIIYSLITAQIYWLLEGGASVSASYLQGVFESFWWSIVTFSTVGYGDISPVSFWGKLYGIFSILFGLAIFGLYIGQISASLTLSKMKARISSPDDLANKRVGIKRGTTAKEAVEAKGGDIVEFETIDDACLALKEQEIDALVAGLPPLQYRMKEKGFVLAGGTYARQTYAFVLPKNEHGYGLLTEINRILIDLQESGEYDEIYNKYLQS